MIIIFFLLFVHCLWDIFGSVDVFEHVCSIKEWLIPDESLVGLMKSSEIMVQESLANILLLQKVVDDVVGFGDRPGILSLGDLDRA